MSVLAAIQVIISVAFLLVGVVTVFGIGITGLLFLVPAALFAAVASVALNKSRAAVLLAFASDAVLAYLAASKLQELLDTTVLVTRFGAEAAARMSPKPIEFMAPSIALFLVATAVVAVVLDWRNFRASSWF